MVQLADADGADDDVPRLLVKGLAAQELMFPGRRDHDDIGHLAGDVLGVLCEAHHHRSLAPDRVQPTE